jgi:hypothetical protein
MTEKELDELSERLGARARRREEVEHIREEIRRRRGMGVGRLAAPDAGAHMPLKPGGGRVHRLRLLQPE